MGELNTTLHRLTVEQHLLAGLFLLGYGAALGSMFSPSGRLLAGLLSMLAAIAFAASTDPWEHGVLLVVCAIGGVAVFIALASALSRVGVHRGQPVPPAPAVSGQAPQLSALRGTAVRTARTAAQAARRRRRRARTA